MKFPRLRRTLGSRTLRGALAIAGGTAGGQLVALVVMPVLSRLYDPVAFGAYAVVTASAVILSSVLSLRLERAVAVPQEDETAFRLVWLGIASIVLGAAVLVSASVVWREVIAGWLGNPGLAAWVWCIPIMAALAALFALASQMAVRARRYTQIGLRNTVQPTVMVLAQLVLYPVRTMPGLIVGNMIGRTVGVVGLLRGSGLRLGRVRRGWLSDASALLREYWKFPVLGVPAGLLNTLGLQLPPILMSMAFGASVGGQFGMAFTIVALPVTMAGNAIGQVFLGEFARMRHVDPARSARQFAVASRRLLLLAVVVCGVLATLSTVVFPLVLGADWGLAGELARAMSLMVAARLVAAPLAMVLAVLERQGVQLMLDTARVLIILTTFAVASHNGWGPVTTVASYSVLLAVVYVLQWAASWRAVAGLTKPAHGSENMLSDRRGRIGKESQDG